MDTRVYCYAKCSTCKKALKYLDDEGISYEMIDQVKTPPSAEELRTMIERSGLPIRRFFNTSGMKYRELGLKDKLDTMTDDEKYALLASDGMLIKRPILVTDQAVLPGFRQAQWAEALGLES